MTNNLNCFNMKELRDYQKQGAMNGVEILNRYKILYMAWSVRTGKSATSMEVARLFGAKKVLFLTKKKAIDSITSHTGMVRSLSHHLELSTSRKGLGICLSSCCLGHLVQSHSVRCITRCGYQHTLLGVGTLRSISGHLIMLFQNKRE